ncbi:MAG: hypothetical protein AAB634_01175 [Patescibacteria group bacterium]
MVNKEVVDYVQKSLAEGYSIEQISMTLSASGWNSADIHEVMGNTNSRKKTSWVLSPFIAGIVYGGTWFLMVTGGLDPFSIESSFFLGSGRVFNVVLGLFFPLVVMAIVGFAFRHRIKKSRFAIVLYVVVYLALFAGVQLYRDSTYELGSILGSAHLCRVGSFIDQKNQGNAPVTTGGVYCVASVATKKKDMTVCEDKRSLGGIDSECVTIAAKISQNPSWCQFIPIAQSRSECLVTVTPANELTSVVCGDLENESARNDCILNVAVKSKNHTVCEKIIWADRPPSSAEEGKEYCRQATQNQDPQVLRELNKVGDRAVTLDPSSFESSVLQMEEAVRLRDPLLCPDRAFGIGLDADQDLVISPLAVCYAEIATVTNNIDLCESISWDKDTCIRHAVMAANNIEWCDALREKNDEAIWVAIAENARNNCIADFAFHKKDAEVCNLISLTQTNTREMSVEKCAGQIQKNN